MSLTLYRYHSKDCQVHALKLKPSAKRFYMDCDCPIWMVGSAGKTLISRRSTGCRDLAAAEAVRQSLTKSGQDQIISGPTIEDCVARFIDSRRHELGDKTSGAYELLLGRLVKYCTTHSIAHMKDLTVDILEDFKVYGLPKLADTTRGNAIAKLRCFLKAAFRRSWTEKPLAESVTPHGAIYEQKSPYTDAEVDAILAGALKLDRGRNGYASVPGTFRLLLELMLETGMRVSDAVRFSPEAVQQGDRLWIYSFVQTKRKKAHRLEPIEVYLSDRLKRSIDSCQWLSRSRPFWFGSLENQYRLGYQVYDTMQSVGERCGVVDCRPHRLRDTFAVRALLRGLSISDVSRLLGHSSVKITEAYYAKWVPARQRRLESLVAESFVNPQSHALGN